MNKVSLTANADTSLLPVIFLSAWYLASSQKTFLAISSFPILTFCVGSWKIYIMLRNVCIYTDMDLIFSKVIKQLVTWIIVCLCGPKDYSANNTPLSTVWGSIYVPWLPTLPSITGEALLPFLRPMLCLIIGCFVTIINLLLNFLHYGFHFSALQLPAIKNIYIIYSVYATHCSMNAWRITIFFHVIDFSELHHCSERKSQHSKNTPNIWAPERILDRSAWV